MGKGRAVGRILVGSAALSLKSPNTTLAASLAGAAQIDHVLKQPLPADDREWFIFLWFSTLTAGTRRGIIAASWARTILSTSTVLVFLLIVLLHGCTRPQISISILLTCTIQGGGKRAL